MKWTDWIAVDHILCGEKFGSLRSVRIQLTAENKDDLSRLHIRQNIVDHFPLLMSTGLLEVGPLSRR
jgi:hypothetical protein